MSEPVKCAACKEAEEAHRFEAMKTIFVDALDWMGAFPHAAHPLALGAARQWAEDNLRAWWGSTESSKSIPCVLEHARYVFVSDRESGRLRHDVATAVIEAMSEMEGAA